MSVGEILERDENRPAYVRFERRAVDDKAATLAAGHYVSKDEDYALITPPYSKDCVEKKVSSWFPQVEVNVKNGRVPQSHLDFWKRAYQAWKDGQEEPINGTSVKDWNALSPAQCKNLISAGCRTIEDLAQANDEALKRIGMGAIELRQKAKAWLQAAKDHGPITMEIVSLQKENDQLKGSIESMQEQIRLLTMQLGSRGNVDHIDVVEQTEEISVSDIIPEEPVQQSLEDQYIAKFGKKPHHLMKPENILKKLQE